MKDTYFRGFHNLLSPWPPKCISKPEPMKKLLLTLLLAAVSAQAQDAISLKDAVVLAVGQNKSLEASAAVRNGAQTRVTQARSGLLPKVNYAESWTRSNNPVFVFGSLLSQRQFGAQDFEIGSLNSPNFINNFQSQITVDQTLYGAGQTKQAVRSAEIARDLTSEEGRRTQTEVIAQVANSSASPLPVQS
jgi:outer membrane protein TolC